MKKYSVKAILFNILIAIVTIATVFIVFIYSGYPIYTLTESMRTEYPMLPEYNINFMSGVLTIAIYVYSTIGIFGLFCI